MTGNIDQLSEKELEERMKQILDDHKNLIDGDIVEQEVEEITEEPIPSKEIN